MGHSVAVSGFRLGYWRGWRHRLVGFSLRESLLSDQLLQRRLGSEKGFIYGRCQLLGSSFGRRRVRASLYCQPLQRVLLQLHRRRARRARAETCRVSALLPLFLTYRLLYNWVPLTSLPFSIRLYSVSSGSLPVSSLTARYLLSRLRRGFSPARLSSGLLAGRFGQLAKDRLMGLLLQATGRFTRSQMASRFRLRRGRLPLSTHSIWVDCSRLTVQLKYGCCSFTIWFAYAPRL